MNKILKLLVISSIILLFTISSATASKQTSPDTLTNNTSPKITINTTEIQTGDSIDIYIKDANNNPLANQNLTANIDDKNYSLLTDLQGKSNLKLNLKPNNYLLNIIYNGNSQIPSTNETFNINILKINTNLTIINTTLIKGNYFYAYLKNQNNEVISNAQLKFTVNGKTYKDTTNSDGRAGFKISLKPSTYSVKIIYAGDDYFNSISKTIKLLVPATTSLVIGNTRLLTNGYLRIYLKSPTQSVVGSKTVKITINNKIYIKKTNNEGIIVFKPNAGTGTLTITVEYGGTTTIIGSFNTKIVIGIKGNVKNPLKKKIPFKNGVPDIDWMSGNYVMADGDFKYTLKKSQYKKVIKRDSYCLFLNKKLSKYTFFKSKTQPKLNHIIKREKWNVIERAINTKIVKKNKKGYWPKKITVSLKGKSYTYSEVRDKQNTPYTCAPTSASMCSQVLRHYIPEKQFAKKAGTTPGFGTKCQWIKKALKKLHFKASYFTKKSFSKALKKLKKGGCALIFHAYNHYVAILDISKNGKKVLLSNSYGRYDVPGASLPNKWLRVKYVKTKFCSYDQRSLIVKLNYHLKKHTKKKINIFYSNMGKKWVRHNTKERILDIGY